LRGGAGTGCAEEAIDSPVIAASGREPGEKRGPDQKPAAWPSRRASLAAT